MSSGQSSAYSDRVPSLTDRADWASIASTAVTAGGSGVGLRQAQAGLQAGQVRLAANASTLSTIVPGPRRRRWWARGP